MAPVSQFHFRNHGIQIVPGVLSPEEIKRLKCVFPENASGIRDVLKHFSEVRELTASGTFRSFLKRFDLENATVVRSLFFDKNPERNWNVRWHQDVTIAVTNKIETANFGPWSVKDGIVHVQPPVEILRRIFAVRVHLDDCDRTNGALRVIPSSHHSGKLTAEQIHELSHQEEYFCEVKSGDAVLMRPLLLHASSRAKKPKHRRVIHLEFSPDKLPNGLSWYEVR